MTALTADRTVPPHKLITDGAYFVDYPVAASTVIFKGGFVGINAAGNLVMHVPEDLTSTQGAHKFVGIAQEHITSQSSAGDATCKVQVSGYFRHALTAATIADVGKAVYVTDSQTIAKTGVASIDVIGTIITLESSAVVIVRLNDFGTLMGEITRSIKSFDITTADSVVMLLHESENHNGGFMSDIAAVITTQISSAGGDAVLTVSHTRSTETTLGLTLTPLTGDPALDLVVSSTLGKMFGVGTATKDNLIAIPADVSVQIKTTTAPITTPAGVLDIAAKIFLL